MHAPNRTGAADAYGTTAARPNASLPPSLSKSPSPLPRPLSIDQIELENSDSNLRLNTAAAAVVALTQDELPPSRGSNVGGGVASSSIGTPDQRACTPLSASCMTVNPRTRRQRCLLPNFRQPVDILSIHEESPLVRPTTALDRMKMDTTNTTNNNNNHHDGDDNNNVRENDARRASQTTAPSRAHVATTPVGLVHSTRHRRSTNRASSTATRAPPTITAAAATDVRRHSDSAPHTHPRRHSARRSSSRAEDARLTAALADSPVALPPPPPVVTDLCIEGELWYIAGHRGLGSEHSSVASSSLSVPRQWVVCASQRLSVYSSWGAASRLLAQVSFQHVRVLFYFRHDHPHWATESALRPATQSRQSGDGAMVRGGRGGVCSDTTTIAHTAAGRGQVDDGSLCDGRGDGARPKKDANAANRSRVPRPPLSVRANAPIRCGGAVSASHAVSSSAAMSVTAATQQPIDAAQHADGAVPPPPRRRGVSGLMWRYATPAASQRRGYYYFGVEGYGRAAEGGESGHGAWECRRRLLLFCTDCAADCKVWLSFWQEMAERLPCVAHRPLSNAIAAAQRGGGGGCRGDEPHWPTREGARGVESDTEPNGGWTDSLAEGLPDDKALLAAGVHTEPPILQDKFIAQQLDDAPANETVRPPPAECATLSDAPANETVRPPPAECATLSDANRHRAQQHAEGQPAADTPAPPPVVWSRGDVSVPSPGRTGERSVWAGKGGQSATWVVGCDVATNTDTRAVVNVGCDAMERVSWSSDGGPPTRTRRRAVVDAGENGEGERSDGAAAAGGRWQTRGNEGADEGRNDSRERERERGKGRGAIPHDGVTGEDGLVCRPHVAASWHTVRPHRRCVLARAGRRRWPQRMTSRKRCGHCHRHRHRHRHCRRRDSAAAAREAGADDPFVCSSSSSSVWRVHPLDEVALKHRRVLQSNVAVLGARASHTPRAEDLPRDESAGGVAGHDAMVASARRQDDGLVRQGTAHDGAVAERVVSDAVDAVVQHDTPPRAPADHTTDHPMGRDAPVDTEGCPWPQRPETNAVRATGGMSADTDTRDAYALTVALLADYEGDLDRGTLCTQSLCTLIHTLHNRKEVYKSQRRELRRQWQCQAEQTRRWCGATRAMRRLLLRRLTEMRAGVRRKLVEDEVAGRHASEMQRMMDALLDRSSVGGCGCHDGGNGRRGK